MKTKYIINDATLYQEDNDYTSLELQEMLNDLFAREEENE